MPLKRIFDTTGPIAGRLGDMTKEEAVRLGIALCFAVGRLLEADHGHGGIWPGIIRIGPEETVIVDPARPDTEPSANELEYAAPEHFWNGISSPAGDVYSIGLVLYAALNHGRLPFIPAEGTITPDYRAEALKQRMKGDVPMPFPASVDGSLREILQRALAFNPEERWETPMAMHDALCNCAADAAAGILLPETGTSLFGKEVSDMSEIERMMSEILDQDMSNDMAKSEPLTESEAPSATPETDTDKLPADAEKSTAPDEEAAESDAAEPELAAETESVDAGHPAASADVSPEAEESEPDVELHDVEPVDSPASFEANSLPDSDSADVAAHSDASADSPAASVAAGTILTGLAALAEVLDGQPAGPGETVSLSDHADGETEPHPEAAEEAESMRAPDVEPAASTSAPSEAAEAAEPAAPEVPGHVESSDALDLSPEPEEVPVTEAEAVSTVEAETPEEHPLPESAESEESSTDSSSEKSNTPLDEMIERVDSNLDAMSNSLFSQPSPDEEAARRQRIADAVEAQEKAKKRKKRKRRASITAILLMLAAALAAIFLLARSFGFQGFSFSDIGDAFYDSVFSKIFSNGKDDGTDNGDKTPTEDTKKEDGAEAPVTSDKTTEPDNTTATPDPTTPDTTATESTSSSNPTSNTETNNTTPSSNNTNSGSNSTAPSTGNHTGTDVTAPEIVDGGTSGSGAAATSFTPDSTSPTYQTMVSNCTWQQADFVAREFGGHLVTISNEEEFQQVIALAESAGASYVWLGAYRNSANDWVWVTGEAFSYAPWQSGEPSGKNANGETENYLLLCKVTDNGTTSWVYNDVINNPQSTTSQSLSGKMIYIIEYN